MDLSAEVGPPLRIAAVDPCPMHVFQVAPSDPLSKTNTAAFPIYRWPHQSCLHCHLSSPTCVAPAVAEGVDDPNPMAKNHGMYLLLSPDEWRLLTRMTSTCCGEGGTDEDIIISKTCETIVIY